MTLYQPIPRVSMDFSVSLILCVFVCRVHPLADASFGFQFAYRSEWVASSEVHPHSPKAPSTAHDL